MLSLVLGLNADDGHFMGVRYGSGFNAAVPVTKI